ncbi:hypothetical protein GJ744_009790 [Endocarpon pusillum]|uniref:C2H2-type domain-containing protein n=1 Tax=Endocarpon pusillum TaxID=364733 RepID=A0A8H7E7K0_9EURO|nr:hypothetical protein GJ744_009790 [Endocarpon pusillum]
MDLGQWNEIQNDTASENVLMSDAIPQINDDFDSSEAYITSKSFTEPILNPVLDVDNPFATTSLHDSLGSFRPVYLEGDPIRQGPFKCLEPGCDKVQGFTYSGGLLRHQREVHRKNNSIGRELYCPVPNCNRSSHQPFTRQENLKEHMRRRHLPEGEINYTSIGQVSPNVWTRYNQQFPPHIYPPQTPVPRFEVSPVEGQNFVPMFDPTNTHEFYPSQTPVPRFEVSPVEGQNVVPVFDPTNTHEFYRPLSQPAFGQNQDIGGTDDYPSPYNEGGRQPSIITITSISGSINTDHITTPSSDGGQGLNISIKRGEPPRNDHNQIYCAHPECAREGLIFRRSCEWNKHMNKHDRPYKCLEPGCDKVQGFSYSGGLLRHQWEVHKKNNSIRRKLYCPVSNCNRSSHQPFARQENLKEHMRRWHLPEGEITSPRLQSIIIASATPFENTKAASKENASSFYTPEQSNEDKPRSPAAQLVEGSVNWILPSNFSADEEVEQVRRVSLPVDTHSIIAVTNNARPHSQDQNHPSIIDQNLNLPSPRRLSAGAQPQSPNHPYQPPPFELYQGISYSVDEPQQGARKRKRTTSHLYGPPEQKIENTKAGSKESASDTNSLHGDSRLVDNKVASNKLVPSDSGYHTGLGTDTDSVCTLGSVGTSLGLSQDFLQDFIAFFGDTLIDKAGARAWAGYALVQHAPEVIEHRLDGLLKDYAIDLLSISQEVKIEHKQPHQAIATDGRIASGATKLIRRYRPKIARYFRDHAVSTPPNSKSMAERLRGLGKQLSLTEKLGLFEKVASGRTDADNALDDECDDGDEGEYMADIAPIRDFLVSSKAFQDLAIAIRRSLYCDDRTGIDRIAYQILERLSEAESAPCLRCSGPQDDSNGCSDHRPIYSVRFQVSWSPEEFLQSQFGNRAPRIGSLVTLTGSALYAQATTCSEYLQTNWPRSGSFVLSTLQKIIDPGKGMGSKEHRDYTGSIDGLDLRMAFRSLAPGHEASKGDLFVDARGTAEMLVELAQQLAWIGAVLRSSPYDEKLAYCRAAIQSSGSTIPCFAITFQSERLYPTENSCWLPLFCGASIARDFPIPDRREEMGLEIPLEIMMGIAGVRHAVEYEGGVVMKGFSIMFVPMKRSGNRVQWHLISSPNCDTRLSYRDVLDRCQDRASLNEVDLGSLRTTRAIVGWCSAASSLLGSNAANYGNIDYSGAKDADTPLKLAGGVLGFQQFGLAQLDFTLGPKDGKCHFQRSGPYQRIISAAEKTPVVLYDTAEERAWLVPASGVMLHMAHHRNWLEPFETNGKWVELPATGPAGPPAKEILLGCASMDLSDCGEYAFKDMVINIWSQLEFLIDQNVRRDGTPGAAVTGKLRDVIHGFEFKAVVEERSPFRRKQKTIGKTSGGWPALIRDIDALVLFAKCYEDIIRPQTNNNNQSLCSLWRTVPKGKDYLAASVKTLKDLYDVAGCRLDQTYLTSTHLQWHRGNSTLFEPCKTPGAYRCQCIRLQRIVPKSAIGRVVPPGLLVDDAAVIFGQSASPLRGLIAAPQKPKPNGIYSQPNVSLLTPATVCHDRDDALSSVNSESEPSARSGSDVTSSTPTSYTSPISQGSIAANLNDLKSDPEHTPSAKKRSQAAGESVKTQYAPECDAFSLKSRKRTRNSPDYTVEDPEGRIPELGDATNQDGASHKNQKQNRVPIGGNLGGRDEASLLRAQEECLHGFRPMLCRQSKKPVVTQLCTND